MSVAPRPFDLGPYQKVAQSAMKAMVAEPLWTVLILGWRTRPGHRRGPLLAAAAAHLLTALTTLHRLNHSPEVVQNAAWVRNRIAGAIARYWFYAALMPPRTMWRGHTGDVPFFMQLWGPATLLGINAGIGPAFLTGTVVGMTGHLGSAWINGEPLLPPRSVRHRITTLVGASMLVGAGVSLLARILDHAGRQMEAEQQAFTDAAGRQAAVAEAEAVRVVARAELEAALTRVRAAVVAELSSPAAGPMLDVLDAALRAQWSPTTSTSLNDLVLAVGTAFKVQVDCEVILLTEHAADLPAELVEFIRFVLEVTLDNTRRHGGVDHASVRIDCSHDTLHLTVTDRGHGPDPSRVRPGHGLGRVADFARQNGGSFCIRTRDGGGTEVCVTCRI